MPDILLVDDDEAYRYTLARALRAAGFTVLDCVDYRAALDALEGPEWIGVLITDLVMPVHGVSLGRMAKVKRPSLPIILVTAYDVPDDDEIGPFNLVVRKTTIEELVSAARGLMPPRPPMN